MTLPPIKSTGRVPFEIVATPEAVDATSCTSMSKLYAQYCAEEGCKVNSAFLNYILDRGDTCALTTLAVRDNYLGPKGLRPVVRLIADCQTLTTVELGGNGANNDTVALLCEVAEAHVSLSSISLRGSPITVAGGRRLLEMLECTPRIVELDVTGTDILDALKERICSAADLNRLRAEEETPQLVAAIEHGDRAAAADSCVQRSTKSRHAEKRPSATLTPLQRGSADTAAPAAILPPAVKPAAPPTAPRPTSASNPTRLPPAQLAALRAKFDERARLYAEVVSEGPSREALQARAELVALEANAPVPPPLFSAVSAPPVEVGSGSETAEDVPTEAPADAEEEVEAREGDAAEEGEHAEHSEKEDRADEEEEERKEEEEEREEEGPAPGAAATPEAVATVPEGFAPVPPPRGTAVVVASGEEKFQLLFDEGCREYSHRDLDAAYMAWAEALQLAEERGNREWVSVVSSNLQRLSYEILVAEGVEQLRRDELQAATQSFTFAMDIAVKTHNAEWESAMRRALKQVQSAVFRHSHEAALALFAEAVKRKMTPVDEAAPPRDEGETHYVVPGTDIVVEHTQAFLSEWPVMLMIRDAVATWGECVHVTARIGGSEGAELRATVADALTPVAAFLARHHLDAESETAGLGWQGTSDYHYWECVLLSELWRELLAHSDQTLKHALFGTVVAIQLGCLYMATNELAHAEQQFSQAVRVSGEALGDPLLEATAAMFSAMLCWHRAMYAEAEAQFLFAIRKCEEEKMGVEAEPTATATSVSSSSHPQQQQQQRGGGSRRLPRECVPSGYVQVVRTSSEVFLVRTLVSTYRHREALERLEHALTYQYDDMLTEKMHATYGCGELTSLDQVAAFSAQIQSTLVYYLPTVRYSWDVDARAFAEEESLYTWVVPQTNEMHFVEVNVSRDMGTTIGALLASLREGLCVVPDPFPRDSMITTLHRHAWVQPLQQLYTIFMDPIIDFVQAMSPLVHTGAGIVTVVPTGSVWGVPFHALMSPKTERFLVEAVAVQLCFSATQAAFAALTAQRVQQRDLHRDVVAVPGIEVDEAATAQLPLAFPMDARRGQEEGEEVFQLLQATKDARACALSRQNHGSTITARSELLVADLVGLEAAMPRARTLHLAFPTTYTPSTGAEGGKAALCVPTSHSAVAQLRASQISRAEVFAELVAMTCTNISQPHVSRCSSQDHALCLVRSFFSSGAPCVVAGLWCTPDMKPSLLFTEFYRKLYESGSRRIALRQSMRSSDGVSASDMFDMIASSNAHSSGGAGGEEAEGGDRQKAVALAQAIRALFDADPALRYAPRLWAGYYCMGNGYM